ncbi:MAG: tetratricopeptide repeat protein [Candidatus Korobacteraceae bacterium]|jgi:cytochrome c-type biogenesis protein CcmH/NrfG
MTDTNQVSTSQGSTSSDQWTSVQAYVLAVICLLVGIAGGWFIRGSQSPAAAAVTEAASPSAPAMGNANPGAQAPTPAEMQKMADTQAAPLIEKLKADPNNAGLIENVGNVYYDAQQYPTAIDYYQRALKIEPANTGVRTDMATAIWYTGNADGAIAEFQKSLTYEPNKANTLFNLGVVEWQGKMDIDKAVATWQKLLDTNPNYEGRAKVLELMAQAKKHSGVKPGTQAKPLS